MMFLDMADNLKKMGGRLKEARLSKEMTQAEMAEAIGLGTDPGAATTYGNYERGTREIHYRDLIKLCDVTGFSEKYILRGKGLKTALESLELDLSILEEELQKILHERYEEAKAEQVAKKIKQNQPLADWEMKLLQDRLKGVR